LPSLATAFADWRVRIAHLTNRDFTNQRMAVQLVHPDARVPMKEHVSDSGYDLTLLYEKKRFGRTILYGTGVIVEAPFGWYFDVVPRSSIIKHGYILANSVGVIDRSYRGEIFVPLIKIDDAAQDLQLPARVAQLIPRPIVHFPVDEVHALSTTQRGSGGFGSTG
jgi:dUTP pyrophosphatase